MDGRIDLHYILGRLDALDEKIQNVYDKLTSIRNHSNNYYLSKDNFDTYKSFIDEKFESVFDKIGELSDLIVDLQDTFSKDQKRLFEEVLFKKDIFRIIVAVSAFFTVINIIISIVRP